jgi:hypothetical protein
VKKYKVYITYKETRVLEVEAENEEEAEDQASIYMDDAKPIGEDDYEFEVEEIDAVNENTE